MIYKQKTIIAMYVMRFLHSPGCSERTRIPLMYTWKLSLYKTLYWSRRIVHNVQRSRTYAHMESWLKSQHGPVNKYETFSNDFHYF